VALLESSVPRLDEAESRRGAGHVQRVRHAQAGKPVSRVDRKALDTAIDNTPDPLIDKHVRPLTFAPAAPAIRVGGKFVRAGLYGDSHFPFADRRAIRVVQSVFVDYGPDVLVHMGDLLDCYTLSRYDKNPDRKETLQDEIDQARLHLAEMRDLFPNARFVYLEGNHEDRLRRILWNLEGPAAVLAQLTAFKKAITWPALLGLEKLHIEFVPYAEQARHSFLPKFIIKHGTVVRSRSAYTANGEHAKYGKSGASGHTHRLGAFYHRDHNGNHVWLETGCTCRLDPEYTVDPDWQQGAIMVTFDKATGAPEARPIYIHEGSTVFGGERYSADARRGKTAKRRRVA
jgi:predicted phosphodiesterase